MPIGLTKTVRAAPEFMSSGFTLVSPRLYQRADGVYFARLLLRGRRTWRRLKAIKLRAAIAEVANTKWEAPAGTLAELADLYTAARCPNRKLEPREETFTQAETARVTRLKAFFGRLPAASIRLADLPRYKDWRIRQIKKAVGGERTVDLDLVTLSNILSYGVATGQLEFNYISRGRPCYRRAADIRHSRAVAPASAEIIHRLALHFFDTQRSEVFGWQALFAAFTGCRTSELLRLRLDADAPGEPGHVAGNILFLGQRSKHGIDPWVNIFPEFAAMLTAHRRWHAELYPESPWYFPGRYPGQPVDRHAFGHALRRACAALGLPHVTPHGFRSFYVTKRRSDGLTDTQIAGEIGDKTVALMQRTYGARPANWTGGKVLTWLPSDSLPAWQKWLPSSPSKPAPISDWTMGRTTEKTCGNFDPRRTPKNIGAPIRS